MDILQFENGNIDIQGNINSLYISQNTSKIELDKSQIIGLYIILREIIEKGAQENA